MPAPGRRGDATTMTATNLTLIGDILLFLILVVLIVGAVRVRGV